MDKKTKPGYKNYRKNAEDDGSNVREKALDKIRQMEFLRNKQESWQLAGSSSKSDELKEKKKYKDEDSYFEGTSREKNKRNRRPRPEASIKPSVPPGFSLSNPSGPPPVNAWTQKKGSALFNKPPDAADEEDEMLKLALQESMKTAAEEERRHLEQLRRYNTLGKEIPETKSCAAKELDGFKGTNRYNEQFYDNKYGSYGKKEWKEGAGSNQNSEEFKRYDVQDNQKEKDEEDWEEEEEVEDVYYSSPHSLKENTESSDLQFVDTDSAEETSFSNSRRKLLPRPRKSAGPQDDLHNLKSRANIKSSAGVHSHKSALNTRSEVETTEDIFEPSRPLARILSSTSDNQHTSLRTPSPSSRPFIIPESRPSNSFVDHLSDNLKSTLTFGDTQGLLDSIQPEDTLYKSDTATKPQIFNSENYQTKEANSSVPKPIFNSLIESEPSTYSDSLQTDFILHNFIKHEPPSLTSNPNSFNTDEPTNMFPVTSSQQFFAPSQSLLFQQQSPQLLNKTVAVNSHSMNGNGLDSSSSLSNSPIQSNSPFGSLEKQITPNILGDWNMQSQSPQLPPHVPINLQSTGDQDLSQHLPPTQQVNNLASQVPYSVLPSGYVAPSAALGLPLNPQLQGLPQYQVPLTNLMLPLLQNPDLLNPSSPLYQTAQLQQYMLKSMQQAQQQAHLAALGLSGADNLELLQKEQTSTLGQVPPQTYPGLNPYQFLQTEHQPPAQPVQNLNQAQTMAENQLPIANRNQVQDQLQMISQMQIHHSLAQQLPKPLAVPKQGETSAVNQEEDSNAYNQVNKGLATSQAKTPQDQLKLQQLQQQVQSAWQQIQSITQQAQIIGVPQHLLFPPQPQPMAVPYYPGVPILPQALAQQQMNNLSQLSTNNPQGAPVTPPLYTAPELNLLQTSTEPKIGRGRGRLQ